MPEVESEKKGLDAKDHRLEKTDRVDRMKSEAVRVVTCGRTSSEPVNSGPNPHPLDFSQRDFAGIATPEYVA